MSFYIFQPAVDTPETGNVYPQVSKMRPGYDYKAHDSVHSLSKEKDQLPDYTPNLDYFVVNSKAKLSDVLSVSVMSGGFLVSEKFRNSLQKFSLPIHKFYTARVFYKEKFFDYYWLHIICNLTDWVDYKNSMFFRYYNYAHNLGSIEIFSKEDLIEKRNTIEKDNPEKTITIWGEKIKLRPHFNNNLDLFKIGMFDANTYISEQLREEIIDSKLTGLDIQPANTLL